MGLKLLPKVTTLHLAQVRLPESHPAATFGSSVPVYGFAIGHPDGTILVDTGVGHGSAVIDDLYQPERSELDECLVRLGIDIDNVIAVVNSHLHFDHCGQNPLLHGHDTRFYSQAAEIDAVNADPYYTVARRQPDRLLPAMQREPERFATGLSLGSRLASGERYVPFCSPQTSVRPERYGRAERTGDDKLCHPRVVCGACRR